MEQKSKDSFSTFLNAVNQKPVNPDAKIGVWSTYYDQADPFVIQEEDGSWRDLTVADLRAILKG